MSDDVAKQGRTYGLKSAANVPFGLSVGALPTPTTEAWPAGP